MTATDTAFAQPGEELLTVADICKRLKMGKSKVSEFIATGELESFKIGSSRRITEEQLQAFLARQIEAAKGEAVDLATA